MTKMSYLLLKKLIEVKTADWIFHSDANTAGILLYLVGNETGCSVYFKGNENCAVLEFIVPLNQTEDPVLLGATDQEQLITVSSIANREHIFWKTIVNLNKTVRNSYNTFIHINVILSCNSQF